MPDYISAIDTAAKWGISKRRVALLCEQGRIPGASKLARVWIIPASAEKPADARIKNGKYIGWKRSQAGQKEIKAQEKKVNPDE